jgi:hypothetical protein
MLRRAWLTSVVTLAPALGCSLFVTTTTEVTIERIEGTGAVESIVPVAGDTFPDGAVAASARVTDRLVLYGDNLVLVTSAQLQLQDLPPLSLFPVDEGDDAMRTFTLPNISPGTFALTLFIGSSVAAQSTVFLLQGERGPPGPSGPPGPPAEVTVVQSPCLGVGVQRTINGEAIGPCEVFGSQRWPQLISTETELAAVINDLQQVQVGAGAELVVPFNGGPIALQSSIQLHHLDESRIVFEGAADGSTLLASTADPIAVAEAGHVLRLRGVTLQGTGAQVGVLVTTGGRMELAAIEDINSAITNCATAAVANLDATLQADRVVISDVEVGVVLSLGGNAMLTSAVITTSSVGVQLTAGATALLNDATIDTDGTAIVVAGAAAAGYGLQATAQIALFLNGGSFEGNGAFASTDGAVGTSVSATNAASVSLLSNTDEDLLLEAPTGRPHLFATNNASITVVRAGTPLSIRSSVTNGAMMNVVGDACTTDFLGARCN